MDQQCNAIGKHIKCSNYPLPALTHDLSLTRTWSITWSMTVCWMLDHHSHVKLNLLTSHIHLLYLLTYLLMSIGKHSDMDKLQTQDCSLLWTADVDLWLNSKDCRGSKSYDPHTSADQMTPAWEQYPRSSPVWTWNRFT